MSLKREWNVLVVSFSNNKNQFIPYWIFCIIFIQNFFAVSGYLHFSQCRHTSILFRQRQYLACSVFTVHVQHKSGFLGESAFFQPIRALSKAFKELWLWRLKKKSILNYFAKHVWACTPGMDARMFERAF